MPDVICNTSPLQYLHQLGCLEILPSLARTVVVPDALRMELQIGMAQGVDLPDLASAEWVVFKRPTSAPALPLAASLGPGESSVLALALETAHPLVILDDALGRRTAQLLQVPFTGTLGLLLDAKNRGLIPVVRPLLDKLDELRFRLSTKTRAAVLTLAKEN